MERALASGGFGHVLLAHDRELDRPVAIKVLTAAALSEAEQITRFREEGRVTAALEHPHVVRVLDQGLEDGVPWIAYELLPGGSLRHELERRGALSAEAAAHTAWQVAAALDAAHARGVLHRDVKPENVLAADAAATHWKLTDFGIARWAGREGVHTATGVVLGTPTYLAPDFLRGEPASAATDLYALGVVLFELLAGAPPFVDDAPLAVLQRHLQTEPPLARLAGKAPDHLVELVARLLAKHPTERPGSAAAVMRALKGDAVPALGPGAARPRATGKSAPTTRPSRKALAQADHAPAAPRRGLFAAALGAAVLAVGALAASGLIRRPAPPAPASATPAPAPRDSAGRLAALRASTARAADWDAAARELARDAGARGELYILNSIEESIRQRNDPPTAGRPPWTVELARARALTDGSAKLIHDATIAGEAVFEPRPVRSQAIAWTCFLELFKRHGPGAAALLEPPLLTWTLSEFDRRRTAFVAGERQTNLEGMSFDMKQGLTRAVEPGAVDVMPWWPPLAIGALERTTVSDVQVTFLQLTMNAFRTLGEKHRHLLQPAFRKLAELAPHYPQHWLLAALQAEAAVVRNELGDYRRAMQEACARFAARELARGDQSPGAALATWHWLVRRMASAAYAFGALELIDDAEHELARLVPDRKNPPSDATLRETAALLAKYRADLDRRLHH